MTTLHSANRSTTSPRAQRHWCGKQLSWRLLTSLSNFSHPLSSSSTAPGRTELPHPQEVPVLSSLPTWRPALTPQQAAQQGGQERPATLQSSSWQRALTRASTRAVTGPQCLPWPATSAPAPSQGRSRCPLQNPGFLGNRTGICGAGLHQAVHNQANFLS